MAAYERLSDFLQRQPHDVRSVTLTFARIEQILDERLPRSMYREYEKWMQVGTLLPPDWRLSGVEMEDRRATFVRGQAEPKQQLTSATRGGKYDTLTEYLRGLPSDSQEITISFDEIESILGDSLPEFMFRSHHGWTNSVGLRTSRAWLSAGWRTTNLDLAARRVSFVRSSDSPVSVGATVAGNSPQRRVASGRRGKYVPLAEYLQSLPTDQTEVHLTFREIEDILGDELPPFARTPGTTWWSNSIGLSHAATWLSAGWTTKVNLDGETARFVRSGSRPGPRSKAAPPRVRRASEGGAGRYQPITDYFVSLPEDRTEALLSFQDMEEIIGADLPPWALRDKAFWTNTSRYPQARAWMSSGWKVLKADLAGKTASFVRFDTAPSPEHQAVPKEPKAATRLTRSGKYAPLTQLLLDQPADSLELPMAFADIERVLGTPLPPCVRRNFKWWSNTRQLRQGQSWLSAGWAVRRLDLANERIVFVREGEPDPEEPRLETRREPSIHRTTGRHSKYQALGDYFRSLPHDQAEVTLAFSDVEEIMGTDLPPSAYKERTWWANTRATSQASQWLDEGWELAEIDMGSTLLGFTRRGTDIHVRRSTSRGGKRGAYTRLRSFLEAIPSDQEQVALSFSEMERVMESRLPETARNERTWWANTDSLNQTNTWMQAGWRVEFAHMQAGVIVFRRPNTEPAKRIRQYVHALLDGSVHLDRVDPTTLGRWIRVCKQLGWYFEGTVLYERCGVVFEDADDLETATAQEDYEVCKRQLTRHGRSEG